MSYAWEGHDIEDVGTLCQRRDPRRYPHGVLLRGMDGHHRLQWFANPAELAAFLLRIEPQRAGVRGAALAGFKERVQPIIDEVAVFGLNEATRTRLTAHTEPHYAILWWGTLESLQNGNAEGASALQHLPEDDMDLVARLRSAFPALP